MTEKTTARQLSPGLAAAVLLALLGGKIPPVTREGSEDDGEIDISVTEIDLGSLVGQRSGTSLLERLANAEPCNDPNCKVCTPIRNAQEGATASEGLNPAAAWPFPFGGTDPAPGADSTTAPKATAPKSAYEEIQAAGRALGVLLSNSRNEAPRDSASRAYFSAAIDSLAMVRAHVDDARDAG